MDSAGRRSASHLASGVMKVFIFDKVSADVSSFGALPREARAALGILKLVCAVGLIAPAAFRWQPRLTVLAAQSSRLRASFSSGCTSSTESLCPSLQVGIAHGFIAYGRTVLKPIT